MTAFRVLLAVIFLTIVAYTIPVAMNEGFSVLYTTFFGDIAKLQWPGQFNLDFMGFLILSGTWIAWRHRFSPAGLAIGFFAMLLGAPYLCAYLFIHSLRVDGDWAALLLGEERAKG